MILPQSGPIHCGPSGWSHAQWQGVFYPEAKSRDFHQLEFTSRFFNSVEMTSSFYGPLRPELSQLWCRQVRANAEFQFAVRLWKRLSHELPPDAKDVAAFRAGVQPLLEEGKLGAVLMQFPSSFRFTPENRARFVDLRRELKHLPLVAEFRHASWMEEDALSLLIDYHVGFCNIDQPQHSRAMPPTAFLTSPIAYARLCGRSSTGSYQYSMDELSEWTHRVRKISRYAKRTFVVMSNDAAAKSLVNAFQMKHLLGLPEVRAPHTLLKRFPVELSAIRPDRPLQVDLFGSVAA